MTPMSGTFSQAKSSLGALLAGRSPWAWRQNLAILLDNIKDFERKMRWLVDWDKMPQLNETPLLGYSLAVLLNNEMYSESAEKMSQRKTSKRIANAAAAKTGAHDRFDVTRIDNRAIRTRKRSAIPVDSALALKTRAPLTLLHSKSTQFSRGRVLSSDRKPDVLKGLSQESTETFNWKDRSFDSEKVSKTGAQGTMTSSSKVSNKSDNERFTQFIERFSNTSSGHAAIDLHHQRIETISHKDWLIKITRRAERTVTRYTPSLSAPSYNFNFMNQIEWPIAGERVNQHTLNGLITDSTPRDDQTRSSSSVHRTQKESITQSRQLENVEPSSLFRQIIVQDSMNSIKPTPYQQKKMIINGERLGRVALNDNDPTSGNNKISPNCLYSDRVLSSLNRSNTKREQSAMDDLQSLSEKIKQILEEEAQRYGIDV